jgi:hypothetical protein
MTTSRVRCSLPTLGGLWKGRGLAVEAVVDSVLEIWTSSGAVDSSTAFQQGISTVFQQ